MNSRAIFEQKLSSHAATNHKSTARLECGLASSAAGGASVPCKFAPGELQKKQRHVDMQECMDELIGGMANEAGLMADAIKSIAGVSAESPGEEEAAPADLNHCQHQAPLRGEEDDCRFGHGNGRCG